MKKTLLATLVFIFGITGMVMAAGDPFANVPLTHWSYAAVDKLIKEGLVDENLGGDYGHAFKADREITRYEMANIVGDILQSKKKATDSQIKLINKLQVEYFDELNTLNLIRKDIVKQDKESRVTLGGGWRSRFLRNDYTAYDPVNSKVFSYSPNNDTTKGRVEIPKKYASEIILGADFRIDKNWSVRGEYDTGRDYLTNSTYNDNFPIFYVSGKIKGISIQSGRFTIYSPYPFFEPRTFGAVFNDKLLGNQVTFGKTVKTTLAYGEIARGYGSRGLLLAEGEVVGISPSEVFTSTRERLYDTVQYSKIAFVIPQSKVVSWQFATHHAYDIGPEKNGIALNEAGFGYRASKDFRILLNYAKSDVSHDNTMYGILFRYKNLNANSKPGDYMAYAQWVHLEQYSFFGSDYGMTRNGVPGTGWEIGASYVLQPNVTLGFSYSRSKATANSLLGDAITSQLRDKYYTLNLTYSFGSQTDDIDLLK